MLGDRFWRVLPYFCMCGRSVEGTYSTARRGLYNASSLRSRRGGRHEIG
jgi:hypothetical protein